MLSEVGAKSISLDDVHDVFDGLSKILDSLIHAFVQEQSKHGQTEKNTLIGDELQLSVGLVAWMLLETYGQAL